MECEKCLESIVDGYNVTKFNIFGTKCQDPIIREWKNEFPPPTPPSTPFFFSL